MMTHSGISAKYTIIFRLMADKDISLPNLLLLIPMVPVAQHFRGEFGRYPPKRGHVDFPTISVGYVPVSYVRPYVGS